MKRFLRPERLPAVAVGCGLAAMVLRWALYAFGMDARGLMIPMHPLSVAADLLTVAVLVYLVAAVWQLDGSNAYGDNFGTDRRAALGHYGAAAGIAVTVAGCSPMMQGWMGMAWTALGVLAPVCLVAAGSRRQSGKVPFYMLYLAPCLFLVMHIVDHYQGWSGDPRFQDYGYTMLGMMALMFFAFYTAEFSVEMGRRRMQLGMGLAAVYLCTADLMLTRYPWLNLGGIVWALTGLCSLTPVPKPEPEQPEKSTENER